MKIRLENLRAFVSETSPETRRALFDYLTVEDPNAYFRSADDPNLYLYDRLMDSFLSGLLPDVRAFVELDLGEKVELEDARVRPPGPDWTRLEGFGQTLADHQVAALRALEKNTRGIFHSPTASGKGSALTAVCHVWKNCRWLVLVHRAQIAKELGERFTKLTGEPHGLVAQGRGDVTQRVVFGTCQSFYSQRKNRACQRYLESVEGLIADEAHSTASAESYHTVVNMTPSAYWRLATSGTPLDRGDARNSLAVGAFGPVICKVEDAALVEAGLVADCTIFVVSCRQNRKPKSVANASLPLDVEIPDWARDKLKGPDDPRDVYNNYIAFSDQRNALVERCCLDAQQKGRLPAILFVKLLAHGRMLTARLQRHGLRAEFVCGSGETTEVKVRAGMIERLGADGPDGLDVIVGNVVLQEGIDQERIRTVINGAAGASKIQALQQIGRARRIGRTIDKKECFVYEIQDFGHRYIERHARTRLAACRKAGYRIVNLLEDSLPSL